MLIETQKTNSHRVILNKGMLYYRGRRRATYEKPFGKGDMLAPQPQFAFQGRYNKNNEPMLYLCQDARYIPFELNPLNNNILAIATFQGQRNFNLFNMTDFFGGYEGYISEYAGEEKETAYAFTNFLTDCCRLAGYDGIIYTGIHDPGRPQRVYKEDWDHVLNPTNISLFIQLPVVKSTQNGSVNYKYLLWLGLKEYLRGFSYFSIFENRI